MTTIDLEPLVDPTTVQEPEVAELAAGAARSDASAWKGLVNRYGRMVHSIARAHGLSDADAADVGQTVWLLRLPLGSAGAAGHDLGKPGPCLQSASTSTRTCWNDSIDPAARPPATAPEPIRSSSWRSDEREDQLRQLEDRIGSGAVAGGLAAGSMLSFQQVLVLVEAD